MSIEALKTMKEQLMGCIQGEMTHLERTDTKELGEAIDMVKDLSEAIYYCTITESMEKSDEEMKRGGGETYINYYTRPEDNYRQREREMNYMYYPMPMYYPSGGSGGSGGSSGGSSGGQGGNSGGGQGGNSGGQGGNSGGGQGGNSGGQGGGSGRSSGGNNARGGGTRGYEEPMIMEYYPEMGGIMRDPREGRSPMRRRMYMEGKENHSDQSTQLRELEAYLQQLSSDITEMVKDASQEEKATLRQKMSTLASKIV